MGESISEATIVNWVKQVGDKVEIDDTVIEIATDKVDSDVPSPVEGILIEQLVEADTVAQVGQVLAIIETEGGEEGQEEEVQESVQETPAATPEVQQELKTSEEVADRIPGMEYFAAENEPERNDRGSGSFLSPLVRSIAERENISETELESIQGSGLEGRITKQDMLRYIENRGKDEPLTSVTARQDSVKEPAEVQASSEPVSLSGGDEIIEMDRMRRLIAEHMVHSAQTAPHVCSFVEADVTNVVHWRNKIKKGFEQRGEGKITYTPIFIEAVVKAIRDFPMINVSVDGTRIIKRKAINVGMAAALPSGNLIVPVIKDADQFSLVGLSKAVNDLAERSRAGKLKPDETQGGTFTLTNIGGFGNIMGTPIINQPQVAILAVGSITKKPAVLETSYGDVIAIRHMMFLSLSYDHRVVDGALGGRFLRRVADYLEQWDVDREI